MKLKSKSAEDIKIGDIAYSCYTGKFYIVSILPRINSGEDKFALVRLDGRGYYYLRSSLEEIKKEISMDGGETKLFESELEIVVDKELEAWS